MDLSDNLEEFLKNKFVKVSKKKSNCKIIIYGSYFPLTEKDLLREIRDYLQEDGYEKTWLVEDFQNFNNLTVREKSITCLEFSDINLFIITFEGKQGGLTVELEYIIQRASTLSFKTIVFFEEEVENGEMIKSLSQLQIDGLIEGNIRFYPFERENYLGLFQSIRAKVFNMHYHYVITENRY